jgi:thioesterase domain-containing protein
LLLGKGWRAQQPSPFEATSDTLILGWSLGGILSLEMASQIAADPAMVPRFRVLGVVLVDSICPFQMLDYPELIRTMPREKVLKSEEELKAMKLKEKVAVNMNNARVMIQTWQKPLWSVKAPPTAILLRAKEAVDPTGTSFVDYSRKDSMLGWHEYSQENGSFIKKVVDIEGHHFSIFEEKYVSHPHCGLATHHDS